MNRYKNFFLAAFLLLFYIILFFVPFVEKFSVSVSFFDIIVSDLEYRILLNVIVVLLIYSISVITLLGLLSSNKLVNLIALSISLLSISILTLSYAISFMVKIPYSPSWSFYLSLMLLIGWIAYLFSPKWFPRLKKAFAGFRSKHPTKAERIAELEREVKQLKSQDESTDISSNSDSNEKTSD